MNLALNCWFSQCYNTRILNAKLSLLFYIYLLFNLRLRFIADDSVAYHRVIHATQMPADNSWARRRLKHLDIAVNYPVCSRDISRDNQCIFGLSCWMSTRSSTFSDSISTPSSLRAERGLQLPGCRTVLWLLFSRLSMLQSFQPLSGNSCNSLRAPYPFDR